METVFASINVQDLLRVLPFKGDQDVRYYLNGVSVEPDGDGALLVATNGHVMGAIKSDNSKVTKSFILNVTKAFASALKKVGRDSTARVVIRSEKDRAEILTNAGAAYVLPDVAIIDGTYPDWRKVVPTEDKIEPGLPGMYQSKYLRLLISCIESGPSFKYGNPVMFFHQKDSPGQSAVLIKAEGDNFIALVMPMRAGPIGSPVPAWAKKTAA